MRILQRLALKCKNRKIRGWQFEVIFRISGVWHVGWWNLITSVRLIQVGNNRNGPFQVLFRCPRPLNRGVRLLKVSFKVNKGNKFGYCPLNRGCPLNTGFTVSKYPIGILGHYTTKTFERFLGFLKGTQLPLSGCESTSHVFVVGRLNNGLLPQVPSVITKTTPASFIAALSCEQKSIFLDPLSYFVYFYSCCYKFALNLCIMYYCYYHIIIIISQVMNCSLILAR